MRSSNPGDAGSDSERGRILVLRLALVTGVILCLGTGYALSDAAPQVQPARVLRVNGTVEIKPSGQAAYRILHERERVRPGDTLRTGSPGEIILEMSARNFVRIGPGTEMVVSRSTVQREIDPNNRVFGVVPARRDRQDVELDLRQGTATNLLRGLTPNAQFNLRTPVAVAGVRGTVFVAEVGQTVGSGGAPAPLVNFICIEGQVAVNPLAGIGGFSPMLLNPGMMMSLQPPTVPSGGDAPAGPPAVVSPPVAAPPEVLQTFTATVQNVENVATQDASSVDSPQPASNDQTVINESQSQSSHY